MAADDTVAPAERRELLRTTLAMNGVMYSVRVEHVFYDNHGRTLVYHQGHKADEGFEKPNERPMHAIEVSLSSDADGGADSWIAFRVQTAGFEPSVETGLLVVPPVAGVGVWRRADGDRLLIGQWGMSSSYSACTVWAVEPNHRMAPVPRVLHNRYNREKKKNEWTPDPAETFAVRDSQLYVANVPVTRWRWVDPDCRIFLSRENDAIQIVRGAWGGAEVWRAPRERNPDEYIIETYRYDLNTTETTVHAPTPEQIALFNDLDLKAPPKPLRIREHIRDKTHGARTP